MMATYLPGARCPSCAQSMDVLLQDGDGSATACENCGVLLMLGKGGRLMVADAWDLHHLKHLNPERLEALERLSQVIRHRRRLERSPYLLSRTFIVGDRS